MKRMNILHFGFFDNQCMPTRSKHLESSNEIHFYIAHKDVSMLKLFHWHICGRLDIHQINAASKWVNQMNLQICSPRLMVWLLQSRVIVCTCMCYIISMLQSCQLIFEEGTTPVSTYKPQQELHRLSHNQVSSSSPFLLPSRLLLLVQLQLSVAMPEEENGHNKNRNCGNCNCNRDELQQKILLP